jgi:predicted peptidase
MVTPTVPPVRSLAISLALAMAGLCALPAAAQEYAERAKSKANLDALARVQVRTYKFEAAGNVDMEYRLYVPTTYNTARATPLVIALHGLGSGTSYMMEYSNLPELAERYGYIVATPLGHNPRGWYGARGQANGSALSEQDVMNVLKEVRASHNVDPKRVYLIGQSMGGGGTWYLGSKYADIWAALAPMAPAIYLSPDILQSATHLPVMVIQGDADESVDVKVTRQWVDKMKALGMKYEYIEVPGGTHSSARRQNIDKVFAFLDKQRKP